MNKTQPGDSFTRTNMLIRDALIIFGKLLLAFLVTTSYGQPDKPSTGLDAKLDTMFSSFNNSTPGLAVTVLQKGKVITKKNYGLASLEHSVPFTHNTVVRLPYSEGREFISIATVLMQQKGLLKLDDKVRTYFPQLPAWSEPVTIRDLMNHRSGFVDEWATLLLTQASMQNRFDVEQFLNLLYTQPKPEVQPGKGYMYSNSDFGLLRLILEKASRKNLQEWMQVNVFAPLGMTNTRLHDDKDDVIPGFAPMYYRVGRGYKIWSSDKTSPGGDYFIATSVSDLEKWAAAHADKSSAISKATTELFINAQLMPGKDKNYVFGYKMKSLGNNQIISHQGVSDHAYITRTKSDELTVILLSNATGATYPYHAGILSHLLNHNEADYKNKEFPRMNVRYTSDELRDFVGTYLEEDSVTYESFTIKRKELFSLVIHNDSLQLNYNNTLYPLEYISKGVFKDVDFPVYIEFTPSGRSYKVKAHTHYNNSVVNLVRDTSVKWKPSTEQLESFAGKYHSAHLDFYWTIEVVGDKLIVKRPTIKDTPLIPHVDEKFTILIEKYPEDSFPSFVKFHKNNDGTVTHLTVTDARLMGHRFDKME